MVNALILTIALAFSSVAAAERLTLHNSSLRDFAAYVAEQTGETVVYTAKDVQINISSDSADLILLLQSTVTGAGLSMTNVDGQYVISTQSINRDAGRPAQQMQPASPVRAPFGQQEEKAEPLDYPVQTVVYPVDIGVLRDVASAVQSAAGPFQQSEILKFARGDIPKPSVQVSVARSSVMITGPEEFHRQIRQVISRLNQPMKQVTFEAIIFESTNINFESVGFDYREIVQDGVSLNLGLADNLNFIVPGVGIGYSKNGSLKSVLQLLETADDTRVLSTPTVQTVDRTEGRVEVGKDVPFLVAQEEKDGRTINRIQRKTVGLTFAVTPTVLPGNKVRIAVELSAGSISTDSSAADIITNTRKIQTTADGNTGELIYLGGLITDEITEQSTGVPGLSKMPVLGSLFGRDSERQNRTYLGVFIRPTITI